MQAKRFPRLAGLFLLSVLVTALAGTVLQSQINLAAISALGAPVGVADRLAVTAADLLGFAPTLAGLALPALLVALPLAAWVARHTGASARTALYALAGWGGLLVAFAAADAAAPMPTLIAATRSFGGALTVAAAGALGGWLFARGTRSPVTQGA